MAAPSSTSIPLAADASGSRRRRFVVNKEFQRSYAYIAVAYSSFGAAITAILIALVYASADFGFMPPETVIGTCAVAAFLVNTVYVYVYSLRVSHRIAGPIFKIKQYLKRLSKNDDGFFVQLRKDDLLHDFADELNDTVTQLKQNRLDAVALTAQAQVALQQGRHEEAAHALAALQRHLSPK